MKKHSYILVGVLINILILLSIFVFTCCTNPEDNTRITTISDEFIMVKDEMKNMYIYPEDIDYDIKSQDESIVTISENKLISHEVGNTKVVIRHGDVTKTVTVKVYDAIVTRNYETNNIAYQRGYHKSITSAIKDTPSGGRIYVDDGRYEEIITLDKDMRIEGARDTVLLGANVGRDAKVTLEGLSFYSREYPLNREGSIVASEGANLTVLDSRFFIDKKTDKETDRLGGYAIYVRSDSLLIDIRRCDFAGYKSSIKIESTDGHVMIEDNKFSMTNIAIWIDVRDLSSPLPINKNTTGLISGNTYYNVVREVEFLYAGSEYNGKLTIEKHDQL